MVGRPHPMPLFDHIVLTESHGNLPGTGGLKCFLFKSHEEQVVYLTSLNLYVIYKMAIVLILQKLLKGCMKLSSKLPPYCPQS